MPFTVSEQEIAALLPLNPHSFVSNYVRYASDQTVAPSAYHLLSALALASVTAPASFRVECLPGGRFPANLYALVTGRPAVDKKTTAVQIATRMLGDVLPDRLGDANGSWEGIQESLAPTGTPPNSNRLLGVDEFGEFLGATRDAGYGQKLKKGITRLFDCGPIVRPLARGKVLRVPHPRMSILAASNASMITDSTTDNDWDGGFMSRFLVFNAHRAKTDEDVKCGMEEEADYCRSWLVWKSGLPGGSCGGLTPAAERLYKAWMRDSEAYLMAMAEKSSTAKIAAYGRVPTMMVKAAMLFAWDLLDDVESDGWMLTTECVERGARIAELHWLSAESMAELAYSNPDSRNIHKMLSFIPADGTLVSWPELVRSMNIASRTCRDILDTLRDSNRVHTKTIRGVIHVGRIVEEDEAAAPFPTIVDGMVQWDGDTH